MFCYEIILIVLFVLLLILSYGLFWLAGENVVSYITSL